MGFQKSTQGMARAPRLLVWRQIRVVHPRHFALNFEIGRKSVEKIVERQGAVSGIKAARSRLVRQFGKAGMVALGIAELGEHDIFGIDLLDVLRAAAGPREMQRIDQQSEIGAPTA